MVNGPFFMVPKWLLRDCRLSLSAKVLLCVLTDYQRSGNGQCNPRIETLAADMGASERTIDRALVELQRTGLIRLTWGQRASQYEIATREEWQKILKRQNDVTEENPVTPKWRNVKRQNGVSDPPLSLLVLDLSEEYTATAAAAAVSRVRKTTHPQPVTVGGTAAAGCDENLKTKHTTNGNGDLSVSLVNELMSTHPEKGLPRKAYPVMASILSGSADPVSQAESIRASHRAFCEEWRIRRQYDPKAFVPQLWRWLQEDEYQHPPSAEALEIRRKPPVTARRENAFDEMRRRRAEREAANKRVH